MADPAKEDQLPARDKRGRWQPGESASPDTKWGPGNPPPKSPGRPRTDAWVSELKEQLEERPELRMAIANRLLKLALKGGDQAALKAIAMIEDRVGGPVVKRFHAEFEGEAGVLVAPASMLPHEWIEMVAQRNATAEEPGREDRE